MTYKFILRKNIKILVIKHSIQRVKNIVAMLFLQIFILNYIRYLLHKKTLTTIVIDTLKKDKNIFYIKSYHNSRGVFISEGECIFHVKLRLREWKYIK